MGIAPIFFIGSGISRKYIQSPDWIGLLKNIVKECDINFIKLVQKYTDSNGVVINEGLAQELEDVYLEYPIVFMGYSISDRNIISILSTIFEMLFPSKIEELKSRS